MATTIKLSEKEVYALFYDDVKIDLQYEVIEDTITSADEEDGGADHELIIKHIPTGKFYRGYYTDWDIENTDFDEETQEFGRCDLDTTFTEVKPKQVKVTKYE